VTISGPQVPNPGSEYAQALGCICAVYDNNRGKYPPYPPDGWWVTEGCPLHKRDYVGNGHSLTEESTDDD
jgi:hypothetical protein